MQFTARQLNKLSQKQEKEAAKEKKKIKAVSAVCAGMMSAARMLSHATIIARPLAGDRKGQQGRGANLRGEHHPQKARVAADATVRCCALLPQTL
jgi:hypothetical protein